jgi:hypothetical protein
MYVCLYVYAYIYPTPPVARKNKKHSITASCPGTLPVGKAAVVISPRLLKSVRDHLVVDELKREEVAFD